MAGKEDREYIWKGGCCRVKEKDRMLLGGMARKAKDECEKV